MIPEKLTIQELFSRERRFVIPLFQRSYVWNKDEQWAPLWKDILRRTDAHLRKLKSDSEGKVRSHFLGAVVLSNASAQGRSIARCDVIDGQQRLTTLQIFLAALRDQAAEHGAEDEDVAIFRDLTRNPRRDENSEELFKVWPTNADQAVFSKLMKAGSLEKVESDYGDEVQSLPRMVQAYRYFAHKISAFVTSEEYEQSSKDRFYCLMLALKESLQLVVIELEAEDDPQIIFETLNARGQPLLPSDLIRNYIFMKIGSDDADRCYDKYWRQFDDERVAEGDDDGENRFWHLDERQGRLTRPRIDLFIFHYLSMKTQDDIRIGQLFREFQHWYSECGMDDREFLKDLKFHSEHFHKLIAPEGHSRLELFARRLKSLDTGTVYPLLLFLSTAEGNAMDSAELDACVTDIESFMIRRFICDKTPKNYNRFFLSVLAKAKAAMDAKESIADSVRAELLRSPLETNVWPDDKTFLDGWIWKRLYVRSRPDRSIMVLKALEKQMRTKFNEEVDIVGNLTVEHLLPQSANLEDYPYGDADLDDDYPVEEYRDDMMHTVGNLTMLTGYLNTSISNGPFPKKAEKICDDSDLRMNAWLRKNPPGTWNEADIEERSIKLFELAKLIWPKP